MGWRGVAGRGEAVRAALLAGRKEGCRTPLDQPRQQGGCGETYDVVSWKIRKHGKAGPGMPRGAGGGLGRAGAARAAGVPSLLDPPCILALVRSPELCCSFACLGLAGAVHCYKRGALENKRDWRNSRRNWRVFLSTQSQFGQCALPGLVFDDSTRTALEPRWKSSLGPR